MIYLLLAAVSGVCALILFELSSPQQPATGNDVTPDMLLLTSERGVDVNVTVTYYKNNHESESGSFPTGTREIEIQFSGGTPNRSLQYSVLLGRNGAENNPIGSQNQQFFSGSPGGDKYSDCISPQTTGVVQSLYGKVHLDGQGEATVTSAGTLVDQHAYLAEGANDVVGVIDINSPITELAAVGGAGGTCVFPEWPYLGGILWYSPSSLSGEVSIGPLGSSYSVTSSNPPLTDLSSLTWQINGATAISYTLSNDSIAHRQLVESFLAGVASALAAALAVEAAKNAIGKAAEPAEASKKQQEESFARIPRARTEDKHPALTAGLFAAVFLAELIRRYSR